LNNGLLNRSHILGVAPSLFSPGSELEVGSNVAYAYGRPRVQLLRTQRFVALKRIVSFGSDATGVQGKLTEQF